MFIAAGGLGLKQSGLAELVRQHIGSAVSGMLFGPVVGWTGSSMVRLELVRW